MISDWRLAWRMFWRGRGASLLTVCMLAVATAGALTCYTVIAATTTLWADLPQRDRLARIYATNPRLGVERSTFELQAFEGWALKATALSNIAAFAPADRSIDDAPESAVQAVTPAYFETLGVSAIAGRVLTDADRDSPDVPVVIAERLARLKFAAPANAIGKPLSLDGERFTVVGVLPADFWFPSRNVEAWLPFPRGALRIPVTGLCRLRADRTWPEAAAELATVARTDDGAISVTGWTARPIPLDEDQQLRTRQGVIGLLGPALIVLLIGCVNAANLMLARGVERDVEFSIRLALGASRRRIVRQVLVEGALVSIVAAAAGLVLSVWGIQLFKSLLIGFDPHTAARIAFTSRTLLAGVAVAFITPIVVAIVPALGASRPRPAAALSGAVGCRSGGRGYGARDVLVFLEIALASVLVVMGLAVVRLFGELNRIRPSYDPTSLAIADVGPKVTGSDLERMIQRAREVPGVAAVAAISGPVMPVGLDHPTTAVASVPAGPAISCAIAHVSSNYFSVIALPLLAGRPFDAAKTTSSAAIVNVTAAERLWATRTLPTAAIRLNTGGGPPRELTIIGVVADSVVPNRLGPPVCVIYLPRQRLEGPLHLLIRAEGPANTILLPLHRVLATTREGAIQCRPLSEALAFNARGGTLLSGLLATFGALAVLLAAGGVFAVSRHAVLERTRELGVRLALGATRPGLIRMVVLRDMTLVALAIAIATGATLTIVRTTFIELFILSTRDPWFWIVSLLALGGTSTAACGFAARRISRLEPMDALRDL